MRVSLVWMASLASAAAFAPQPASFVARQHAVPTVLFADDKNDYLAEIVDTDSNNNNNNDSVDLMKLVSTTSVMWLSMAASASADSPDWGIFEGRTLSLLHPAMMISLLLFSINTGIVGLLWRRQRTIGDDISALKKTLPPLGDAKTVKEALAKAQSEEGDSSKVPELQAALSTEEEINTLVEERKNLSSKGLRDKHFNQGSLLAFLGTAFAIEGPLNTYARAGKLFPGPHLYAGASLVVLWAAAAACVPYMQKGNDTARSIHIAANTLGIGLFGWQVVSGVPILLKVIEKTQWP